MWLLPFSPHILTFINQLWLPTVNLGQTVIPEGRHSMLLLQANLGLGTSNYLSYLLKNERAV